MSNTTEIGVGDRVTWEGGLGWGHWCFGIVIDEAYQPNQTGVYEGYMVRPDGWDHATFMSRPGLKKVEDSSEQHR